MTDPVTPSNEQASYWQDFIQLKLDACYVREYRNHIGRIERGVATVRAVASSTSIAAWAIWQKHAIVWAAIIALSQLADALQDVFPFRKRRQSLSGWSNALNRLFVEAQRDWDRIAAGKVRDEKIDALAHQLRLRMQRYEQTYIPDGLARKDKLFDKAQSEMVSFLEARYPIE